MIPQTMAAELPLIVLIIQITRIGNIDETPVGRNPPKEKKKDVASRPFPDSRGLVGCRHLLLLETTELDELVVASVVLATLSFSPFSSLFHFPTLFSRFLLCLCVEALVSCETTGLNHQLASLQPPAASSLSVFIFSRMPVFISAGLRSAQLVHD